MHGRLPRLPRLIVNLHLRRYVRIKAFGKKAMSNNAPVKFRFEIYGDKLD